MPDTAKSALEHASARLVALDHELGRVPGAGVLSAPALRIASARAHLRAARRELDHVLGRAATPTVRVIDGFAVERPCASQVRR